jgi:site-specific DNA-cytosine methylase
MNILIACESSGTVREAFRKLGHNAWSCDLLPADDGSPFHVQQNCLMSIAAQPGGWDIVIAHPPCTHLASSGARHFAAKRADGRQQQGIDLFVSIVEACQKYAKAWAIENPIGIMSSAYRKPDQIIQPWQYGHGETKATCLWLHNLPLLVPTHIVDGREARIHRMPPSKDRWKLRSKTYQGIADAMAAQWGTP